MELKLDWPSINSVVLQKLTLDTVLKKHSGLFQDELGTIKDMKAKISVQPNTTPKFLKARPVPFALKPKVEAELERLEKMGVITPIEYSEWETPIVPVVKADQSIRICGDYKTTLNPVLLTESYPLPRIEEIFAQLNGGKRFSKLDLSMAFQQMEMEEDSKQFLTWNTHKGLYRVNRLPFGIASAPAIFERAIEKILVGLKFTQNFQDDIIISGNDDQEHLANLDTLLVRLEDRGLRVRSNKCEFMKDEIDYLGHTLNKHGLQKSEKKVAAVMNAQIPKNEAELRSFLGLVNYYRKFLPNLSTVGHSLNQLLENKNDFQWTQEHDNAFQTIKKMMSESTFLAHYDPKLPITLACDASPHGLGAVISHVYPNGDERPLAFASRSLTKAERNYAQMDREALALVFGVRKFHQYLFAKHFKLVTDNQALTRIMGPHTGIPTLAAARLQRWALILAGYSYDIEYKNTKLHGNADGLSRMHLPDEVDDSEKCDPVDWFYASQFECLPVQASMIAKETRRDLSTSRVIDVTCSGWPEKNTDPRLKDYFLKRSELSIVQGCIMWGNRVVIPPKLRAAVLDELHIGHNGIVKLKMLARSYVWWPGLDEDLENIVKSCSHCLKDSTLPVHAPLHPWTWAEKPWQRIHLDFAGPFKGDTFLVAVDSHSKWPEVFQVSSTMASRTVDCLRTLFARFGLPEVLVKDNGPQFTSEEFQKFCKLNGIKHITSAPYHPSTNGLAERFVQSLKQGLRKGGEGRSVQQRLQEFLLSYRNTPHATTKECPAMLLLKRRLRTRLDLLKPSVDISVSASQTRQVLSRRSTYAEQLVPEQQVVVKDFGTSSAWIPGHIVSQTGPVSYKIQNEQGKVIRRHKDHIIPVSSRHDQEDTSGYPDATALTVQLENGDVVSSPESPSEPATGYSGRYPVRIRHPPRRLNYH